LEAFGAGVGRILPEWLSMLIYILVGVSALVEIFTHKANCKCCDASMQKPM
jgi:uncharacterized membrane protein YuzA (DUF378 family)